MAPGEEAGARVLAVCTSAAKGTPKTPRNEVTVEADHGIRGDAHAGSWHRQISLLARESIDIMKARGAEVDLGSFGENLVIEGLRLHDLPLGSLLHLVGGVTLRVTQIGKECHAPCAIGQAVGHCIMPERGVFCQVVTGGVIRPGEGIEVERDDS